MKKVSYIVREVYGIYLLIKNINDKENKRFTIFERKDLITILCILVDKEEPFEIRKNVSRLTRNNQIVIENGYMALFAINGGEKYV